MWKVAIRRLRLGLRFFLHVHGNRHMRDTPVAQRHAAGEFDCALHLHGTHDPSRCEGLTAMAVCRYAPDQLNSWMPALFRFAQIGPIRRGAESMAIIVSLRPRPF